MLRVLKPLPAAVTVSVEAPAPKMRSPGTEVVAEPLSIAAPVISVNPGEGFAVADCGLKALGMDHGNPTVDGGLVWFCSDEHVTFSPEPAGAPLPAVGDRIVVRPAHIDPTIAYHERLHIADGDTVVDTWAVDLRGW